MREAAPVLHTSRLLQGCLLSALTVNPVESRRRAPQSGPADPREWSHLSPLTTVEGAIGWEEELGMTWSTSPENWPRRLKRVNATAEIDRPGTTLAADGGGNDRQEV